MEQIDAKYKDAADALQDKLVHVSYYQIPNLPSIPPEEWDVWYRDAYAAAAGNPVQRGQLTRKYRKGARAFKRLAEMTAQ